MRKHTVLHIKVNQHHWELVKNKNSRALPQMNWNVWEQGRALSVVTNPALWTAPFLPGPQPAVRVTVTLSGKESKLESMF